MGTPHTCASSPTVEWTPGIREPDLPAPSPPRKSSASLSASASLISRDAARPFCVARTQSSATSARDIRDPLLLPFLLLLPLA